MKFTRSQTILLIGMGVLTFITVFGLGAIVVLNTLNTPAAPVTLEPASTETPRQADQAPPTWTPTLTPSPSPTPPARFTSTPTPLPSERVTDTPDTPTPTASPTITPTPFPVRLINPDFDMIMPNRIPGWKWYAFVNYRAGGDADPETSFAEPFFAVADDVVRQIDGSTLKVETERWLRFRAWVHQTVTVTSGSTLYFKVKARAFSSLEGLIVKAGIDPDGQDNCQNVQWGEELLINQDSGIVTLTSPRVTVPPIEAAPEPTATPEDPRESEVPGDAEEAPPPPNLGRVTVCFSAEPSYPHINNAAFFDQADLIIVP